MFLLDLYSEASMLTNIHDSLCWFIIISQNSNGNSSSNHNTSFTSSRAQDPPRFVHTSHIRPGPIDNKWHDVNMYRPCQHVEQVVGFSPWLPKNLHGTAPSSEFIFHSWLQVATWRSSFSWMVQILGVAFAFDRCSVSYWQSASTVFLFAYDLGQGVWLSDPLTPQSQRRHEYENWARDDWTLILSRCDHFSTVHLKVLRSHVSTVILISLWFVWRHPPEWKSGRKN